MDTQVLATMAKWPNVPAVFGWLRLSARGEWRIRGEPIGNAAIRDFVGRNYAIDEHGRAYFQNGPQRVYVELECAPWVYRLQGDGTLRTHTGRAPTELRAAALVDGLHFVLLTDLGAGNIDDRDTAAFLSALAGPGGASFAAADFDSGTLDEIAVTVDPRRFALGGEPVPLSHFSAGELAVRYGFVAEPQPE